MSLQTNKKKQAMLKALEKTLGNVTRACEIVKMTRKTHYDWLKSDKDYAEQVNDTSEIALDFVEDALFRNIEKGKEASIIFYLKTRGRHRGYSEDVATDSADADQRAQQIQFVLQGNQTAT